MSNENLVAEKFDYQDLIKEMQLKTGYSYFKVRTMLKELSRLIQGKISKGYNVECDGICKIYFTMTGQVIIDDNYYGSENQSRDLAHKMEMDLITVRNFVNNYYSIIKTKIEQGYQVNIKSVCYITPKVKDNHIYLATRMSPQLTKPEIAEFVIFKNLHSSKSRIVSEIVDGKKLRLAMILNPDLKIPNRVFSKGSYEPEFIDISSI